MHSPLEPLPQMVILAGGMGTRLRSIAGDLPKALVPVAGRPFIEHQLAWLRRQGAQRVLLCLGVGADQIEAHVGDGARWGLAVTYVREAPDQLSGTGGALADALPFLEDTFGVLYGDSYLPVDYCAIYRTFCESATLACMSVFLNRNAWDKSNARVADGRVVFYSKTAAPGEASYIDYGLSFYQRAVFVPYASRSRPFDLSGVISGLVEQGALAAHEVGERFYEIGSPAGWAELDALLRSAEA